MSEERMEQRYSCWNIPHEGYGIYDEGTELSGEEVRDRLNALTEEVDMWKVEHNDMAEIANSHCGDSIEWKRRAEEAEALLRRVNDEYKFYGDLLNETKEDIKQHLTKTEAGNEV